MSKINSAIRIKDANTLVNEIVSAFENDEAVRDDVYLRPIIEQLRQSEAVMSDLLAVEKSKRVLVALDAVRDAAVRDVLAIINGYSRIVVGNFAEMAGVLKRICEGLKVDITRENYSAESASIKSLLFDFDKPEACRAIESLPGMREAVEAVRRAEDDFLNAKSVRNAAKVERLEQKSAYKLKLELIGLINKKLIDDVVAMSRREPQRYGRFASNIESRIVSANALVKRRAKKKVIDETAVSAVEEG